MTADFSPAEVRRYARHFVLPEVGEEGQAKLRAARVLLVGVGGLGSPLALYLAAAGVGTLGLVDDDRVEESNLQRQILYGTADVGRPKLAAAAARLRDANPLVAVVPHAERFAAGNALSLVESYDVIADGTDNFPTRYLVNDACVFAGKPNVFGSVQRFEGQVGVFWAERGPCYRCLFSEPPPPGLVPSCAEAGVLGVLPGIVGALQAAEVIKLILGVGNPLIGRLLTFDALRMRFREVRVPKADDCALCSARATIHDLVAYDDRCAVPTTESAGGDDELDWEISVADLDRWRKSGKRLTLLDVRTPAEHAYAAIAGSTLIPVHELPRRLDELDPAATLVTYCHVGGRSAQAVGFLRARGFARAVNLAGGIDAWSREVDPTLPRY